VEEAVRDVGASAAPPHPGDIAGRGQAGSGDPNGVDIRGEGGDLER
jgi:hypothetical protein